MTSIHPLVVHFPIALIALWPLLDGAGLLWKRPDISKAAAGVLVLAAIASIVGSVTGQFAFDAAVDAGADPHLLNTHADLANFVPWGMFAILFIRTVGVLKYGARAQQFAILCGIAMWPVIFTVGGSGGELVYEHGIGVKARVDAR